MSVVAASFLEGGLSEGSFSGVAARLAGLAGWLLGWRPDEFWRATPAELSAILCAAAGQDGPENTPPDPDMVRRLMEMFPDG